MRLEREHVALAGQGVHAVVRTCAVEGWFLRLSCRQDFEMAGRGPPCGTEKNG
jgi:hypothetical protein